MEKIGTWVGVVFTVITFVILALIVVTAYSGIQERARESKAQSDASYQQKRAELERIQQSSGSYE